MAIFWLLMKDDKPMKVLHGPYDVRKAEMHVLAHGVECGRCCQRVQEGTMVVAFDCCLIGKM